MTVRTFCKQFVTHLFVYLHNDDKKKSNSEQISDHAVERPLTIGTLHAFFQDFRELCLCGEIWALRLVDNSPPGPLRTHCRGRAPLLIPQDSHILYSHSSAFTCGENQWMWLIIAAIWCIVGDETFWLRTCDCTQMEKGPRGLHHTLFVLLNI